jgi:hypothetical protein
MSMNYLNDSWNAHLTPEVSRNLYDGYLQYLPSYQRVRVSRIECMDDTVSIFYTISRYPVSVKSKAIYIPVNARIRKGSR